MNYTDMMKFMVAMIIMINPLGSLSIFLDLTRRFSHVRQRKTALKCCLAMTIIMVASIWVGGQILDLMGITISSFRFAGGLILLLVGLAMLQSQETPLNPSAGEGVVEDVAEEGRHSIAVVPLALPIIIGPGAISTLVLASEDYANMEPKFLLSLMCLVLAAGMGCMMYYGKGISNFVGDSVMKLITRIMGMIIMAIAVGMLANGLIGLFPVLQG